MDENGPTRAQEAWVQSQIQEGINASMQPLQVQIAELHRLLQAASTPLPPVPLVEAIATPPPAPAPDPASIPLRTRPLPSPPKFSGKRNEYPTWQRQMRDKLSLDAHLYPTVREQWYLIGSCLDAAPRKVTETFYEAGGYDGDYNPAKFMEYLDSVYHDPNVAVRAAAALRTLRQREDQSFAYFLPQFEQTLAQAGGGAWADSAKITFLEGALNTQLRRQLVSVQMPLEYKAWSLRAQEVSSRLEGLTKNQRYRAEQSERRPRARDDEGDVPMSGMNKLGEGRSRDNADTKRRLKSETRRCYNCQEVGHLAARCRQPRVPRAARTRRGRERSEDEEEKSRGGSEEDDSSSEKE
ncbi:uncharacterized protein DNG_10492 [Cephalotrichum gorgonifer]|uniref:CCHC-type domain-containing protein n=1 Tax=Cephalotrichum gorgonifer TaxID=2041049 RepID=A0AAE8N9C6_9PEZI|nr:uncharacterized protein DNG_10492 [Cephalotrichum gorgonifer]